MLCFWFCFDFCLFVWFGLVFCSTLFRAGDEHLSKKPGRGFRFELHPGILHPQGFILACRAPWVTVVASWSASCLLHCLWLPALEVLKYHCSKVPEAHNWWLGPRPWFLNLPLHTLLQASYSLTPNLSCIFLSACLSVHPCHLCKARSAPPSARGCLLRKVSSTPPSCKCSLSPHVSHELHLCLQHCSIFALYYRFLIP